MAQACDVNGRQQTAKTSCTLGYKRYKEKAWKTTKELDEHHTTRFEKHWHDLGSSTTEKAGIDMWSNVSLTRHELSSKVIKLTYRPTYLCCRLLTPLTYPLS